MGLCLICHGAPTAHQGLWHDKGIMCLMGMAEFPCSPWEKHLTLSPKARIQVLPVSVKVVRLLPCRNNGNSPRCHCQLEEMVSGVLACSQISWLCHLRPCLPHRNDGMQSPAHAGPASVCPILLLQIGLPFCTSPRRPPTEGPSFRCLWFRRDLCCGQPGCNFQASLIAVLPNEDAMLTHIFIL